MTTTITRIQTAKITNKGADLADRLNPYIGTTSEILRTCSLLTRQATSYERIQERWCNDEMSDRETARVEAREARIEARIRDLVEYLPQPDDGRWTVQFDGDPRGYTSRLIAPDGREVGIG